MIQSPDALAQIDQGFETLGALIGITLGPTQGAVVNAREGGQPELLTDSGTIARRVVELPGRGENTGAMVLRNLVWTMRERHGDGAATAAVLARAMLHEASRQIAAGANPTRMRAGVQRGVAAALPALAAQALPVAGQEALAHFATGITGEAALGAMLGELFDLLGEDAAIVIEEFASPHLDREYIDGGRWPARPAARALVPDGQSELSLDKPLVLAVNQSLQSVADVRQILDLAASAPGTPPLLLVATGLTGDALAAVTMNHARGTLTIGAALLTGGGTSHGDNLDDIALITGGALVSEARGLPPARLQPAAFGRARRAILTRSQLTLLGGDGDRSLIQTRIDELRARATAAGTTHADWEKLRLRIARLAGGIGVLKVGASTERQREATKALAKKAVRVLGPALTEGLVPGGGVALLGCRSAVLAARESCPDADEVAGVEVVAAALAAPFNQLVQNHGVHTPAVALDAVDRLGPGHGLDVREGRYACMAEIGVLDSLAVVRAALQAAGSAAGIAMTTDVIVLPAEKRREVKVRP